MIHFFIYFFVYVGLPCKAIIPLILYFNLESINTKYDARVLLSGD